MNLAAAPLLPLAALEAEIDRLQLDSKRCQRLGLHGASRIGDLLEGGSLSQAAKKALGREGSRSTWGLLHELAAFCSADSVNWFGFWNWLGIRIVPEGVIEPADVAGLATALPALARAALADEARADADPERDWIVIDGRNGLVSQPKTLDELGPKVLGVTRERIRQLEKQAIARLEVAWERRFHGTSYRVNPALDPVFLRLVEQSVRVDDLVSEDQLFVDLGIPPGLRGRDLRVVAFMLRLSGLTRLDPDGSRRGAMWAPARDVNARARMELADRIGRLLTEELSRAVSESDIAVELNRGSRFHIKLDEVGRALPLTPLVERRDDGRWQGRFEYLTRRGDQAYRVINAAGRPVELTEVAREINSRSRTKALNARSLSGQLVGDDRFVPIGRSGAWGLASRDRAAAVTLPDLIKEVLDRAGRPMHLVEIETAVRARRVAGESSVSMNLQFRPEFVRLADKKWALASWPEGVLARALARRNPSKSRVRRKPTLTDRMSSVVTPYLAAAPGGERELGDVVRHVSRVMDTIPATVYAYLKKIPSVEQANEGGRKVVRLVETTGATVQPRSSGIRLESRVRELIAQGETPTVEFKSTLMWSTKGNTKDPKLQKMTTKTLAAFANTRGGTLLIGVEPDGSICGIELDCAVLRGKDDTCVDAFSRSLAAITSEHLGPALAAQAAVHYVELEGKTVCLVDVAPSREPVYLKADAITDVYVRSGTTSVALPVPEIAPYIRSHWS